MADGTQEFLHAATATLASDTPRLPQALGEPVDWKPVIEGIKPLILEMEDRIETERRLPEELIDAMWDAGLLHRMMYPREFGGLELNTVDMFDIIFELSRINGSVGWIAAVQEGSAMLWSPEVMAELEASCDRFIAAGSGVPIGEARKVDGGYVVNGHWRFASGAPWSSHLSGLCQVVGDDSGGPEAEGLLGMPGKILMCLMPREEITYLDGWDSLGMRGSGSGQWTAEDVFVAERFTKDISQHRVAGASYAERPVFQATPFHATIPVLLGSAQGAIDAFVRVRHRKAEKWSSFRRDRLGREQSHQMELAHADAIKDFRGNPFQHARPNARGHMRGCLPLQDDDIQPGLAQQVTEHESGRAGANDCYLGLHGACGSLVDFPWNLA